MCFGVPQPITGTRCQVTANRKIAKMAMTKDGTAVRWWRRRGSSSRSPVLLQRADRAERQRDRKREEDAWTPSWALVGKP